MPLNPYHTYEQFLELHNSGTLDEVLNSPDTHPGDRGQMVVWRLKLLKPAPAELSDEVYQAEYRDGLAAMEDLIPDTTELEESIHKIRTAQDESNEFELGRGRFHGERTERVGSTPQQVAARQRAYRSNMLRKLKARFRMMSLFSTREAAEMTGIDVEALARYLANESHVRGGQIGYNEELKKYFIADPLA